MLLENLILIIEVILINISFLAYGALISYLVKFDVNSLVYKVGFNYIFGIIISALTIFLLSLIINPLIIKSIFFFILVIYFFLIFKKKIEFELNPNLIFIIFFCILFTIKNNIVHPDALSGHYEIPFKTILNDRFYFDKQNNFYGFYTYAFNYIYIILNKKNLYEFLFQANLLNLIATFSIIYLCTSAILKEILNKKNTFSIFLTFLILITLPQIVRVGEGLYDFATACIGLYSIFLLQHLNFKIFKEKFVFVIFFCLAVISKFINIFLSPFLIAYVLFFKFYEFRLIKNYSLILIPITIFGIFIYQSIYFHNTFFYPITANFPDFYNQINFERNSLQEQNLFKTTIISLEKIFINEAENNGNLLSLIFIFNFIIFFLSQKKNQINFLFLGSISFFITFVLYNFGNYIINRYFLLFSISQYIIFVANLFYLKTNKKLCNFFLIVIILFNISYLYPKDLSKFNLFKNQSIFNYISLKNFFFEGYLKSWICVYDIKEKNMPDKKYITDGSYNFFTKIDDYYLLGYQNEIVRNKNFNEIKKDIEKYQNFAIFHKNKISTSDEKFYEYLESIFDYKVEINQFLIYSKKSLSKDVNSCNL